MKTVRLPGGSAASPAGGFTVVELMVVVGIIAILAVIFAVNLPKIRAGFELRNAASVAVSEVRRAQAAALAEGTRYAVEFALGKPGRLTTYRESSYGSGTWTSTRSVSGASWPSTVTICNGPSCPIPVATSNPLPNCAAPPGSATTNKCIIFGFFGAPVAAGEVFLHSETGGIVRVVIEPATGRVSAQ